MATAASRSGTPEVYSSCLMLPKHAHQQSSSVFTYMVLSGTIRASGHMIMIMIMTRCSVAHFFGFNPNPGGMFRVIAYAYQSNVTWQTRRLINQNQSPLFDVFGFQACFV
jgi:hypothetical protein